MKATESQRQVNNYDKINNWKECDRRIEVDWIITYFDHWPASMKKIPF